MGLIRKALSVSSGGAVKFTSEREARTKRAIAEARLANAQAREITAEVPASSRPDFALYARQQQEVYERTAAEHVEAHLRGELPKWKLTANELVLLRKARKEIT